MTAPPSLQEAISPTYWIWPIRIPRGVGRRSIAAAGRLAELLGPAWRWAFAGVLAGSLPLLFDFAVGGTAGRVTAAVALAAMLTAAAIQDGFLRGFLLLSSAFAAHCLLAIGLAASFPERLAKALPGGPEYWDESRTWILSGANPEYEPAKWGPTHVATLLGATVFSYVSLGVTTIYVGFDQVDIMCFYAGRLAAASVSPAKAVLLGWHPWSVCRGVGFVILTFEIVSLSFSQLTGRTLSTGRRRAIRWAAGLSFLMLDAGLKFAVMEPVRQILAANLL